MQNGRFQVSGGDRRLTNGDLRNRRSRLAWQEPQGPVGRASAASVEPEVPREDGIADVGGDDGADSQEGT